MPGGHQHILQRRLCMSQTLQVAQAGLHLAGWHDFQTVRPPRRPRSYSSDLSAPGTEIPATEKTTHARKSAPVQGKAACAWSPGSDVCQQAGGQARTGTRDGERREKWSGPGRALPGGGCVSSGSSDGFHKWPGKTMNKESGDLTSQASLLASTFVSLDPAHQEPPSLPSA